MTLSVMPNHMDALHGHSIFKLTDMKSKNHHYEEVQVRGDDGNTIYLSENRPVLGHFVSEKEKDHSKHHVTFSPVVTTAPAAESQEHDVEVQDSTSDQSDALDLAKNGLPSACIFVAK